MKTQLHHIFHLAFPQSPWLISSPQLGSSRDFPTQQSGVCDTGSCLPAQGHGAGPCPPHPPHNCRNVCPAGPSEIKNVPSPSRTRGWEDFWLKWENESGWGITASPGADWGGRGWAAQQGEGEWVWKPQPHTCLMDSCEVFTFFSLC